MKYYTYAQLKTGWAIRHYKRDVLLAAAEDLWMLDHIKAEFIEELKIDPTQVDRDAAEFVFDLTSTDHVFIGTWSDGKISEIKMTQSEIEQSFKDLEQNSMGLFLVATQRGKDWVNKYELLLMELEA